MLTLFILISSSSLINRGLVGFGGGLVSALLALTCDFITILVWELLN